MKNENIPANIKSKSLKETKDEISEILSKLESNETNLADSVNEYKRLIQLNKHIDNLFKQRIKDISLETNRIKKMLKSKLIKNAKKIDYFLLNFLKNKKNQLCWCQ